MEVAVDYRAPSPEEMYLRVKGIKRLDDSSIKVLIDLASWRENTARSRNKPRKFIVDDEILTAISSERPQDLNELRAMEILSARQFQMYASEIITCLNGYSTNPINEFISPTKTFKKESRTIIKRWKSLADQIASCNHIPGTVLYSNKILNEVFRYLTEKDYPKPKLWNQWRKNLLLEPFMEIIRIELPDIPIIIQDTGFSGN